MVAPQTTIDQDITLAAGRDHGTKLPGLTLTLPDASAGIDAFEFSVSQGAIIDWSLRGDGLQESALDLIIIMPHSLEPSWIGKRGSPGCHIGIHRSTYHHTSSAFNASVRAPSRIIELRDKTLLMKNDECII